MYDTPEGSAWTDYEESPGGVIYEHIPVEESWRITAGQPEQSHWQTPVYHSGTYADDSTVSQDATVATYQADPFAGSGSEDWTSTPRTEHQCMSCPQAFNREADLRRHQMTVHVDGGIRGYKCEVDNCSARVTSWRRLDKLRDHTRRWHRYGCEHPGCIRAFPRGFESQEALRAHEEAVHQNQAQPSAPSYTSISYLTPNSWDTNSPIQPADEPTPAPNVLESAPIRSSSPNLVSTDDPFESRHQLDPTFRVQPSSFFKPGKVFKMIWAEPLGASQSNSLYTAETWLGRHNTHIYSKVRRFVVIRTFPGHSHCLPILTYGHRGISKPGIKAQYHAKISTRHESSSTHDEDEVYLQGRTIHVDAKDTREELDPMSLLNYSKVYTVEHNIKIKPIGRVVKRDEEILVKDFDSCYGTLNSTWPGQSGAQQATPNPRIDAYKSEQAPGFEFDRTPSYKQDERPPWEPSASMSQEYSDPYQNMATQRRDSYQDHHDFLVFDGDLNILKHVPDTSLILRPERSVTPGYSRGRASRSHHSDHRR